MIRAAASAIYGAAALTRRRWYRRHSAGIGRLAQPVISIGNLAVGGSGKTPVVESLARLLLAAGERPAILSRGYARRIQTEGVTVVSDGHRVTTDLNHAGDEPLMLARALPGVPVLVAAERYLAGRLAEGQLGATVHLLDDGFQHVTLWRDVDLLLLSDADLDDRVLPAGRLREPISVAASADAILVTSAGAANAATAAPGGTAATTVDSAGAREEVGLERVRALLPGSSLFSVRRTLEPVRLIQGGTSIEPATVGPVFALAAIARPHRFFDDLTAAGWRLNGTLTFPDHHRFTQADANRVLGAVRAAQTHVVVTTAKDLVRLEPLDCRAFALAVAAVRATVQPEDAFNEWLLDRLAQARTRSRPGAEARSTARIP